MADPAGLYAATALRLALGFAMLFAATSSKAPDVLRVLAIAIFLAGLATPFFGKAHHRIFVWWSARGPGFVRVSACFPLTFGLLVGYAVSP